MFQFLVKSVHWPYLLLLCLAGSVTCTDPVAYLLWEEENIFTQQWGWSDRLYVDMDFSEQGRALLLLFVMMGKAVPPEMGSSCVRHAQVRRDCSKSQKKVKIRKEKVGKSCTELLTVSWPFGGLVASKPSPHKVCSACTKWVSQESKCPVLLQLKIPVLGTHCNSLTCPGWMQPGQVHCCSGFCAVNFW